MNTDQLLTMAGFAGKLLIESGAEIYRVEETMVRLCTCFSSVQDAESFVTPTGIMFSVTVDNKTYTKIIRVKSRGVNLNCIDKINALSRKTQNANYSLDEMQAELKEIANESRYSFLTTLFFGALSAGGFAIFFRGSCADACCAFLIGLLIKCGCWFMEKKELNTFFTNAIAAGVAALCAFGFHELFKDTDMDIMIISSIMLLVPGLAITNAIRDTVAGDYLSGVARGVEAFLIAIAIAAGIGFVLSIVLKMEGGR